MEQKDTPSIYDIEFESVYDLDFKVLDDDVYAEVSEFTPKDSVEAIVEVAVIAASSIEPEVDAEAIHSLSEDVATAMCEASWGHFREPQILGIAKSKGGRYLSSDEIHELLALLASHQRIRPLEDGTFSVRNNPEGELMIHEGNPPTLSLDFDRKSRVIGKPLTDKQVTKVLKRINSSPELKRAKDLARRRANPRRRGKRNRSKLQGKLHGKKESVGQLIAGLSENGAEAQG